MSFRCIFIVKQDDPDSKDLQPFCYKSFPKFNKPTNVDSFVKLQNFNEWYSDIFTTIKDGNYTAFSENNIDEYLTNPILTVKTKFGLLSPCILILKKKYVFGGLIFKKKTEHTEYYGNCVDFILNMASSFMQLISKNVKIKTTELLPDFYQYLRILCPYGTPVSNSSNLVELFKLPDNSFKQTHPSYQKQPMTIDQLNVTTYTKSSGNREIRMTLQEIVTCVQHENRSGENKWDADIIGEVYVNCIGFNTHDKVKMNLQLGSTNQFMNHCIITDLLTNSTHCINCTYKSPATVSMATESTNQTSIISPLSINTDLLSNEISASLLSRSFGQQSSLIESHPSSNSNENLEISSQITNTTPLPPITSSLLSSRSPSISIHHQYKHSNIQKPSSPSSFQLNFVAPPNNNDNTLLFIYRIMNSKVERPVTNLSFDLPFIESLKNPAPPLICSYQLEEDTIEATANLIFRLRINPELLTGPSGAAGSTSNYPIEFGKLDILFPFPNRTPLLDVNKCTPTQGRVFIMEQNRRIMFWNIGSNIKYKSEITLAGQIKFKQEAPMNEFLEKFSVPPNAHAQVNFTLKSSNLSGLSPDPKSITVSNNHNVKLITRSECQSFNFKVWNCLGDCSMETIS